MHEIKDLPSFLREEVKESLIEFEQKAEQHLSEREMAIFSFGFEHGQINRLRAEQKKEIEARRKNR